MPVEEGLPLLHKFTLQSRRVEVASGLHVAIIMDGNGRWAERRGLPRLAGHREGAKAVRRVVEAAPAQGIETLTLFAFSADNWRRPPEEVAGLMRLLERYLGEERDRCIEEGVRLCVIGRRDRLAPGLVRAIEETEAATAAGERLFLRIAVDYSAREAIAAAALRLAATAAASGGSLCSRGGTAGVFAGGPSPAVANDAQTSQEETVAVGTGGNGSQGAGGGNGRRDPVRSLGDASLKLEAPRRESEATPRAGRFADSLGLESELLGGGEPPNRLLLEHFSRFLNLAVHCDPPAPDVDLLIRTSGEQRLSDFLLWESAYAELVFTPRLWPDFDAADLAAAVAEFHRRDRRFGAVRVPARAAAAL